MKKAYFLLSLCGLLILSSCRNDDGGVAGFVPARDRGEEAPASMQIIEDYLETHFYNYEEFAAPPANFDYKIKFDTIAGENSDKIPLKQQVAQKTVKDRVDNDVSYTLYYLVAQQGAGSVSPKFPDIATVTYSGTYLNEEEGVNADYTGLFDSSVVPISFDLTAVVNGFQDAMVEFNTASEIIENPDGTIEAVNPGVGAVFIPSGLGYYVSVPADGSIPVYAQLIFTFQLLQSTEGDQDGDGIPSILEDLNGNGWEEDDDTDNDGLPNFFDADDDNDGRPTSEEIEIDEDGNITYPDSDGDGTRDFLDSDS